MLIKFFYQYLVYNKTKDWYTKKLKLPVTYIIMYDWQEQIIIGTVLGGSSLTKPPNGKNFYLSMRSKEELWLRYKVAELDKYYGDTSLQKYGGTFRANSPCMPNITSLHNRLYDENGRILKMEVLDMLMDIGLAIWYLDGGGRTGRGKKNAYLNATKFGDAGAKIAKEYFDTLDMPCEINKSKSRIRILFSVSGTEEFFKITAHRFPAFMYYRLEGIGTPLAA